MVSKTRTEIFGFTCAQLAGMAVHGNVSEGVEARRDFLICGMFCALHNELMVREKQTIKVSRPSMGSIANKSISSSSEFRSVLASSSTVRCCINVTVYVYKLR